MVALNREILIEKYANLNNEISINLSNEEIEGIEHETFNSLENLTSIELSRNKIKQLHHDLFNGLRNLNKLIFSDNQIDELDCRLLQGLNNLNEINFAKNSIKRIDNDFLKAFQYEYVNTELGNVNDFKMLENLNVIDFTNNLISDIGDSAFNGLINLTNLRLGNNFFCKIGNQLQTLRNLTELNLFKNSIEMINASCFAHLKNLTYLCLSYNNLKEITERQFHFLYSLETLDLDYNQIKEIHPDSFRGLTKLINLKLNNNNFKDILINNKLFAYLEESVVFVTIHESSMISDLNDKIINKRTHNKDGSRLKGLQPRVRNIIMYL